MIGKIHLITKKISKISNTKFAARFRKKSKSAHEFQNILVNDFPLLSNRDISYLDSSATTQKPKIVIDKLRNFYEMHNANSHRGIYTLSEEATGMLNHARKVFASFINASFDEIIFTRNSTESLNGIANSLEKTLEFRDNNNIVTTVIEHHSNFVPWQQLSKRKGVEFRVIDFDVEKSEFSDIRKYADENTLIFSITGMSNVTGFIPDLKKIIRDLRSINDKMMVVVDATQLIAHEKIDVKDLDADFLAFSAHKSYGPTGVGVLYGKKEILENMEPFNYGGGMINKVDINESDWAKLPDKFEAGTIDTPGIAASAEAIIYLEKNFNLVWKYEENIKEYALKKLKEIEKLKIIGHNAGVDFGPVISFTIEGVHPHDLADICSERGVCIRAGHHCCQPLMKKLGVVATSRISIGMYNTREDIDRLIDSINHAIKIIR